ncbi:FAD-binding oxidoreductase [Chitinophaga horti]|uniref:FAD-binding oxidoreductase n=1 Tax=Chitinophaga horti TaxID=2920382 RepID=A0ABY6J710_9BACT|nr:FAD-binding oxidoreductase [Chitinophaga horti]UYQ95146.1 FAD-binding oxidoreductase [Chitinophaga horti]
MEQHIVKILSITPVTHDVKCFRFEKPEGYRFSPGQATEVAINKPGWEQERRPFTFTSLNENLYLEFTIKGYHDHNGVTHQLHRLSEGDELLIHDVWGAIEYKGRGYFIAGGAGITPFLAILRQLKKDDKILGNTLFFSNKTAADVICEDELRDILGPEAHFMLSREEKTGYGHARIDSTFLKQHVADFDQYFYVCGPDKMIAEVNGHLAELGAKAEVLVFEQ